MIRNCGYNRYPAPALAVLFMLGGTLLMPPARGDSEVKFHGTLVAASCSADATDVDFGDVALDQVNKTTKAFTVNLTCTGKTAQDIKLRATGTALSGNETYFASNIDGLGMMLVMYPATGPGKLMEPNHEWASTPAILSFGSQQIKMDASLYLTPNKTYEGGNFHITTTLEVMVP